MIIADPVVLDVIPLNRILMTATWNLESSDKQIPARLGFYTGPAAKLPNYETYTVEFNNRSRKFNNAYDADEYALSLGVTEWRFVERNRALPFAALIPIRFDDAIAEELLTSVIARFESGASLEQLAGELNAENNDISLVSATTLRIWMLGHQPNNSKLARLRQTIPKPNAKRGITNGCTRSPACVRNLKQRLPSGLGDPDRSDFLA